MESRLILVEGIPGAGKTTTAKNLRDKLINEGKDVILYEEGMSHPADMAWNAYLNEEEYNTFLEKCFKMYEHSNKTISKAELKNRIEAQARHEDSHVILAYTRIDFPEMSYWNLISHVASKEICDGRRSLMEFKDIHLKRWSNFCNKALKNDTIYIFECAFLQNHIFELMGVYEKSDEEILSYLKDLIETVKPLNPSIIYIEPISVKKVIMQAAFERKTPDPSRKDWIDEISEWVSNINYGKNHGLIGQEGVFSFCEERLRIDKMVLENLEVPVKTIRRN